MRAEKSIFDTGLDTIILPVPKEIKTKFVLRPYQNRQGLSSLYLHASGGSKRIRLPLHIHINAKDWEADKMRVLKSDPNYQDVNLILDNIQSQITSIRTNYRLMKKPLGLEDFKTEMLYGIPRVNVIAYMEYRLKMLNVKGGTKRRYESIIKKVKEWKPTLIFHQVDHNFVDGYRKYCSKKGNKTSTIESNLRFIKDVLIAAKKDQIFFPLQIDDMKLKKYNSNREYLLPNEMKMMFDFYQNKYILPAHKLSLGYFLISCVTGLRVSEIELLESKKNNDDIQQIYAPKTNKKTTIFRTKELKDILTACPDLCVKWLHPNTINKNLKQICKIVGIKKTVSMHVGRHTFAMAYLRTGGDVVTLKTILKHADLKSTMHYVHQIEEEQNANTDMVGSLYH
jgi:integrase